ncbi:MAG: hypothetical protein IPQ07_40870 [Myxococcales bacterium]|nr:hypothetical protein [Myxococcales bacterium]
MRAVFLATALVFTGVAVYLYAFRFFAWLESDAAVAALLAAKVLHAKSPVVTDWYYANGDVWFLGPQLLAVLPVAIFGAIPASLLIAILIGFGLELVVLVKVFARLGGERWIAVFAAMVTMMAWSNAHVAYSYIQLAYGFVTCLYLVSFQLCAGLAEDERPRPWRLALAALLIALISAQNPTRGLVYVVAPLLAACAWPWRAFPTRRRLVIAAAVIVGWALAYALYTWVFARVVSFSIPRGHLEFVIGGIGRIKANLVMLGRGLSVLCASGTEAGVRAIPGALLILGALVLLCREAFASRAFTALRMFAVVIFAQLLCVLVPLLIGNLLDGPEAVRYLMPSLLSMFGLAVVIAIRTLAAAGSAWGRRVAIGWLITVPLAAMVAAADTPPPKPRPYLWPDAAELSRVADELVRRGLTHGFSVNLGANLLTLDSGGAALTCPVDFRDAVLPLRWLTERRCFDPAVMPERFYVVAYQNETDPRAIHATFPHELERFAVGETYEVYVFRTSELSPAWFSLPILDGALATFPMRIPATHLQLTRDQAIVDAGEVVATGAPGTVLSGPGFDLPKGVYTATWIGSGLPSAGQTTFSVTMRRKVIAQTALEANAARTARGELTRLSFTLDRPRKGISFVIESAGGGRVSLHELVIESNR